MSKLKKNSHFAFIFETLLWRFHVTNCFPVLWTSTYIYICSCSFCWPWCKVTVGWQRQTLNVALSLSTTKQAISIKLATTAGHFYVTSALQTFIWIDHVCFVFYRSSTAMALSLSMQSMVRSSSSKETSVMPWETSWWKLGSPPAILSRWVWIIVQSGVSIGPLQVSTDSISMVTPIWYCSSKDVFTGVLKLNHSERGVS